MKKINNIIWLTFLWLIKNNIDGTNKVMLIILFFSHICLITSIYDYSNIISHTFCAFQMYQAHIKLSLI